MTIMSTTELRMMNENVENLFYENIASEREKKQLTTMLDTEKKRLSSQERGIETAKYNQQRSILLNENYVKRYREYFKIFLLIFLAVVFMLVLTLLGIPTGIFIVLSIIVGCIVVISSLSIFVSIISRDHIYFDEISLDPPILPSNVDVAKAAKKVKNAEKKLKNLQKLCSGKSCCAKSTTWDPITKHCVKMKEGFSPIDSLYNDMIVDKQKPTIINDINVIPFNNNEYGHYSKM